VKRLVQEVRNVEAPLSPSSDCHNDIKPLSLCDDFHPSSVPADCSTLLAANCQSAHVPVPPVLDVSDNTGVSLAHATAVSTHVTVTSSLDTCDVSSETCSTLTSCHNVADSDADKKPVIGLGDTVSSLSYNVGDTLAENETHLPSVDTT